MYRHLLKLSNKVEEIVARQLNVKKIEAKKGKDLTVKLDTKITPELEAEGFARELARKVQAESEMRWRRSIEKLLYDLNEQVIGFDAIEKSELSLS